MDREETLNEFLKGLRIVLNNAAAYPKDHPYFINSVDNFKTKVDAVFYFLNPIKINISPESLLMDGRYWEKTMLYTELAQMLHLRKIKSVGFKEGLTIQELVDFLSSAAMPKKEILRRGGIKNILNEDKIPHIAVEELDYSQLLHGEGEETKDIWIYLFGDVIEKKDQTRINEFADNFKNIIGKFKAKDLFEDEELTQNVSNFLTYLKEHQKAKFNGCANEVFNVVLKYKDILSDQRLDNIKLLFKDLNDENLAQLLWDEILTDESFDINSFHLFSLLTGKDRENGISSFLLNAVANRKSLQDNFKATKKVQDLLTLSSEQLIPDTYQNILRSLLKDIPVERELFFDRNILRNNYHYLLINLMGIETDNERLNLVLESLNQELEEIIKEKDLKYIKSLLESLKNKKKENVSLSDLFDELDKRISKFIETIIWEGSISSDLEYFVNSLQKSSLDADFYLDRIFDENKVSAYILKLFFKFFPLDTHLFYKDLEAKRHDIEFLTNIIDSLKQIESYLSIEVLKKIYSFANELVKIEILKAMQVLSKSDEDFLFSVLKTRDISLKKEALIALVRDKKNVEKIIATLLDIPNLLGLKNNIIQDNLLLIEGVELKEAENYLLSLSKKAFFWNRNIRDKAKEILGKWHAG